MVQEGWTRGQEQNSKRGSLDKLCGEQFVGLLGDFSATVAKIHEDWFGSPKERFDALQSDKSIVTASFGQHDRRGGGLHGREELEHWQANNQQFVVVNCSTANQWTRGTELSVYTNVLIDYPVAGIIVDFLWALVVFVKIENVVFFSGCSVFKYD